MVESSLPGAVPARAPGLMPHARYPKPAAAGDATCCLFYCMAYHRAAPLRLKN